LGYNFCNPFLKFSSKRYPAPPRAREINTSLTAQNIRTLNYLSKVLDKKWLTHDVIQLSIEKPATYKYHVGQAVEIFLDKDTESLKTPFTLTSIPEKDEELRFIIKVYPEHRGLTLALSKLKVNNSISITEAWDSFTYNGKGVFIAAGSGITPFIPMLRILKEQNHISGHSLIYANKKKQDIILHDELKEILGNKFLNILSRDHLSQYAYGRIDFSFLKANILDINQNFYLCGPDGFLQSVKQHLMNLGVEENLIQTIS